MIHMTYSAQMGVNTESFNTSWEGLDAWKCNNHFRPFINFRPIWHFPNLPVLLQTPPGRRTEEDEINV